jgi:hypothetical protein
MRKSLRKFLVTIVIGAAIAAVAFLVVRYRMTCCPKTEYFATILWDREGGGDDIRLPSTRRFANRKDCVEADNEAAKRDIAAHGILGGNERWIGRCALITHDWMADRWIIQLVNDDEPGEP